MPPSARRAPGARLRLIRERPIGGLVSSLLHLGFVVALFWGGADAFLTSPRPGDPGPRGGGGGGGSVERVSFFRLAAPAPAPAAPVPMPVPDVVVKLDVPTPDVDVQIEMPKIRVPATTRVKSQRLASVLGRGDGSGGGPGTGTGSGGGVGAGRGTGVGDSIGPGTGGDGGDIFPPTPRQVIIPPLDDVPGAVKGKTVIVTFSVRIDGTVARISVEPDLPRGSYAKRFRQRMMEYKFTPAYTRDGQKVAAAFEVALRL